MPIQYARSLYDKLIAELKLPPAARDARRRDLKSGLGDDPGIEAVIPESLAWLGRAQDESKSRDGGVSRAYNVVSGWGPSYPETTGYIIPTLIDCAARYSDEALAARATRMLDWLKAIQLPSGGFQGGTVEGRPIVPVTFNTGQILMGLARGVTRFGHQYGETLTRAADWLVSVQDDDGAWRKFESPFAESGDKTYDAHSAWGLLEAAKATGNSRYVDAALKNISWAISRQLPNGWFQDCCLYDPARPLTHTLGYALRGVLEGYEYTQDEALLKAARASADGLMSALGPDGFLPGRLDRELRGAVRSSCLTGTVQIAYCWLRLYQLTGDEGYLDAGRRANAYVRRTVRIDGPAATRGAVKGSHPISGNYSPYQYPNWATKFFIDANLLELDIARALS